jgi:hypothetical protein
MNTPRTPFRRGRARNGTQPDQTIPVWVNAIIRALAQWVSA